MTGIGAKIALAILSGASVDEFARLVQAGDLAALTRIPGIGKKTAERIVVELRDRAAAFGGGGAASPGFGRAVPADAAAEAGIALAQLGYKPAEIGRMLKEAAAGESDVTHEILTPEGAQLTGSWEEIVKSMKETDVEALQDRSLSEYMSRVAKRAFRETGVRVPHHDAELFVRGHADAGLLRIVR